jgi:hypothetical protein
LMTVSIAPNARRPTTVPLWRRYWPSAKCSAATLVRTCLAKAIEEHRALRDAACGHAWLTRPGHAHRDKLRLATSPCCVTRSKRLGSPNDDNHRGRCLFSSAPCQPRLAATA